MTTPESLEVMLISSKVPSRAMFAHLQAVVIDEIHAFAGDDRGAHLTALLERLSRFCGRDIQRIGLSATVGNPEEILSWLRGTSRRPGRLIDPPRPTASSEVALDFVGSLPNAAKVIAGLHQGGKRLVFVDSRRRVEQLGEHLGSLGVQTFLTHSSLSADERHQAEQAFETGSNCVIVATSTLELGIDVGDLDAVIQVDAPPAVASFLQRMGRTGRRSGARQNATILCTTGEELAIAAALLRLWKSGFIEPVEPERRAFHVLAQQLMALTLQEGGVPIADWWSWVSGAEAFRETSEDDRAQLLAHMLSEQILHLADGRLSLGELGERVYGRKNFEALYAVFEAPPLLKVLWGPDEIGSVDAFFMQSMPEGAAFYLAGKPWQVKYLDWNRAQCHVIPAGAGKHLNWLGRPRFLARVLAQAVRQLILDATEDAWWTRRTREELHAFRQSQSFCADEELPVLAFSDRIEWHTFLGGQTNALLARVLEGSLGEFVTADNFKLTFKDSAAKSEIAVRQSIASLRSEGRPSLVDALPFLDVLARGRLSKFQPCLPEHLERLFLASRLIELPPWAGEGQTFNKVTAREDSGALG
jgi:ATP-dependent Lhr-like helicase